MGFVLFTRLRVFLCGYMGHDALLAEFLFLQLAGFCPSFLPVRTVFAQVFVLMDLMYFHAGLSLGHYGMAGENR